MNEQLFLEVATAQILAFPVNGQSADHIRAALVRRIQRDTGRRNVIVSGDAVHALCVKHFKPGRIQNYFVL
ncbi:hypothetical protein JXVLWARM_CDS_0084 [Burkholderia phage Bm1]